MSGYVAGPDVYIIDRFALTNPLLARLPAKYVVPKWRIGHFERRIPEGYEETLRTGENRLTDPLLAEYYEHLTVVTQGPLFTWERLKTIARFHWGAFDHLIVKDTYRFPDITRVDLPSFRDRNDKPETFARQVFPETGIHIALGMPRFDETIALEVYGGRYAVLFMYDDTIVAQMPPPPSSYFLWEGIAPGHTIIRVPLRVREKGFTAVRIIPTDAGKPYEIIHVQFDSAWM